MVSGSGAGKGKLPSTVAAYTRRMKVEKYMKRGVMNQSQIAVALGVSAPCVGQDMRAIYASWKDQDPDTQAHRRRLRIKQLEGIMQEALNAYDRSRQDTEEIGTITKPCFECAGAGKDPDDPPCKACQNRGYIRTDSIKITRRDGEAVFLTIAKSCVTEIARLEGLLEKKVQINKTVNGKILHAHAHLHKHEGPYFEADPERLLEARQALARLTQKE